MKKFRDPIHGFIEVNAHEKDIINSPPFQRLRNIKQLALTHYVYHGAEHTRFGHSLGVMHLASKAFKSASAKGMYRFKKSDAENAFHLKWLEQILRLVALTHDLGHAPFSHAGEELFPVKSGKQNEDVVKRYEHEDFTAFIVKAEPIAGIIKAIGQEYKSKGIAYGYLNNYDITPEMICDIYRGKDPGTKSEFTLLKTFMDSEVDCDKMDYLLRDSYYCGVSYGKFDLDRLIESLVIAAKDDVEEGTPRLYIDSGSVNVFEAFVLARYFMFTQVYFHKTRRYFDLILSKALKRCLPNNEFPEDVQEYLQWDDARVMELLKSKTDECIEADCIVKRKSWTCVYTTKPHPEHDGKTIFETKLKDLKKGLPENYKKKYFLLDDKAIKQPHKIDLKKYTLDNQETIAIMNKDLNRFTTISEESYILNNLTEEIHFFRIYACDEVKNRALEILRENAEDVKLEDDDE